MGPSKTATSAAIQPVSRLLAHSTAFVLRGMPQIQKNYTFHTPEGGRTVPCLRVRRRLTTDSMVNPSLCVLCLLLVICYHANAQPFAYVANNGSDSVSIINTVNNVLAGSVTVGKAPIGLAASRDGTRVFVVNSVGLQQPGSISIIDTSVTPNQVIATVSVGLTPRSIAVTPDGTRAVVTNFYSNSVSIIDLQNMTVATIPNLPSPWAVAIAPDSTTAYLTHINGFNFVSVLNVTTGSI